MKKQTLTDHCTLSRKSWDTKDLLNHQNSTARGQVTMSNSDGKTEVRLMNHLELWARMMPQHVLVMLENMACLTQLGRNSSASMDVKLRSCNRCSSKQEQLLLKMPPFLSLECKSLVMSMKQGLLRQSKATLNGPLLRKQSRNVCMTALPSRIVAKVVKLLLAETQSKISSRRSFDRA